MNETSAARDKLVEDFIKAIGDSEDLLKAIAAASGEKAQTLRADLEKQTDEYVHANPWQSIAIAAGVAAIAGIVVGLLLNRR